VLKHQETCGKQILPKFKPLPKRKKERQILSLSPWKFSSVEGKWCSLPSSSPFPPIENLTKLSVITFNVWFSTFEWEKRAEAVIQILKEKDADFVCFQEVTLRFFGALLSDDWLRKTYFLSDTTDRHFGEFYGTWMLSKFPFQTLRRYQDLPTQQGRDFLAATFEINKEIFTCSTVHLESCAPSSTYRKKQLKLIFDSLQPSSTALLVGDMNCAPNYPENQSVDKNYRDVWATIKCSGNQPHCLPDLPTEPEEDPGFTEDTQINTMRFIHSGRRHRNVRYDRIFLRSETWRETDIELLGTEAIGEDVFPSDHFGLLAQLEYLSEEKKSE